MPCGICICAVYPHITSVTQEVSKTAAIAWVQLAAQIDSKSTGARFLGVVLPDRMTDDEIIPTIGAVYENLRLASVEGASDSYHLHDIMLMTYDVSAALATLHALNAVYGQVRLGNVLVEEKLGRARRFHLSELAATGYDHARAVAAAAVMDKTCPGHGLRFAMRQDVYDMGVLIWKMITHATHVDRVDEHTPFTMHPVFARYASETCDLIELARKCLRREPSSRPSSDAVRREVHALLNKLDEARCASSHRMTQMRRKRAHVAPPPSRRVQIRLGTTNDGEHISESVSSAPRALYSLAPTTDGVTVPPPKTVTVPPPKTVTVPQPTDGVIVLPLTDGGVVPPTTTVTVPQPTDGVIVLPLTDGGVVPPTTTVTVSVPVPVPVMPLTDGTMTPTVSAASVVDNVLPNCAVSYESIAQPGEECEEEHPLLIDE
jgi:hypothetical protein